MAPALTGTVAVPHPVPHAEPRVTVIIPTYQRRELVLEAVESVLVQTFTDLELIVVDDGSTDGTSAALPRHDPRLHRVRQEHSGVSAARNRGLAQARGRIVAFLDSDDRWLPDHLAVVVGVLDRLPEAVLVTTAPWRVIGGSNEPEQAWLQAPLPLQLFTNTVGSPSAVAVRRDAVLAVGGFDERLLVGEDGELFTRLAAHGGFAMLQRRTLVKGYTKGLKDWGRREGLYFASAELKAQGVRDRAAAQNSPAGERLARQAEGTLAFVAALRALHAGDDSAVEAALSRACRLAPTFLSTPGIVLERLDLMPLAHVRTERARHLATLAQRWPAPESGTALVLRAAAIVAALRAGRPLDAAVLLARWPRRLPLALFEQGLPVLARRGSRGIDARRFRSSATHEGAPPAQRAHP